MIAEEDTYITEVETTNGLYAGPTIKAKSFEEAEEIAKEKHGYLKVIGKLGFIFHWYELN